MGQKGNGHRAATTKSSRAKNKDKKLAYKHKISRLKRYIKKMPNDLEALKTLKKLQEVK